MTTPLNTAGDRIGIYVGQQVSWLYIRAGRNQNAGDRAARMRNYSWKIREEMGDQVLGKNLEKNSADGMTITVQRAWVRDDKEEWPVAAQWIKEQFERLRAILSEPSRETTEKAAAVPDRETTSGEASASEISATQT